MTREEAIRHLHTFSTTMGSGQTTDEQHKEAKNMAIKALSTGRREDATEEDYAYCDDCEAVEMCMWYPYDCCIFKVRSRPRGEWIEDGAIEKCNQCGEQKRFPHWNFCPNCGADMRGEQE